MAKRKKSKKPKIPSMVSLRRKALALWSTRVRDLQGNKCAICGMASGTINSKGNPVAMNAHHIEDKAHYGLRWDVLNGICLCPTCHKFGYDSAHRSPVFFIGWMTGNRPMVLLYIDKARKERKQRADDYSREDMEAIIKALSEDLPPEKKAMLNLGDCQPQSEPSGTSHPEASTPA